MKTTATAIDGVVVLEPQVFGDARGFFLETFNQRALDAALDKSLRFVQDNHSRSARGVLRGLHWQTGTDAQGKLVRVAQGTVYDVAVDIRAASPTFGRWVGVELSGDNHRQLWIAPGLAHGFLVLSEAADVLYKATAYYAPASERTLRWDDPELAIAWPDVGAPPTLSVRDAAGMAFASLRAPGTAV